MPNSSSLNKRVTLITGATSGIGKAAAQAIAAQGGSMVIVGRDAPKTATTVAELRQTTGNPRIDYLLADLSSMVEVRRLAAEFTSRYSRLDVLINNAGAFFLRRQESVDGLEMTFALNHLSPFLLSHLLLDTLRASAPARIVNVTSGSESSAKPNWDDLQMSQRYRAFQAYACSKRFNLYFTYELATRLEGTGVTVNALHPGMVNTGIWTRNPNKFPAILAKPFLGLARTPEQGAETVVYLATSPEVAGVTGKYFIDKQPRYSSRASQDTERAQRLWLVSEELAGRGSATV